MCLWVLVSTTVYVIKGSSGATKHFILLFFPTYAVVLLKSCKHTLRRKIGEVTL